VNNYAIWSAETTPAAEIAMAFRIEDESRIGFCGALILSCTSKIGARRILSEDLKPRQRIPGILIENPFAAIR
jgi:predicted nucleic acid-binding protein